MTDINMEHSEKNVLPSNVQKPIENIIKKQGLTSYNLTQKMVSTQGSNYLGTLYEVDVKGKTKNGNEMEINLFLKQIPSQTGINVVLLDDVYYRECYAYTELSKIYEELQNNVVPEKEKYNFVNSFSESNTETIILENISRRGFKALPRTQVLSLRFTELSLKQLAKFHGLSMVLETQRPDYFNAKVKRLETPILINTEGFNTYVQNMFNIAEQHLCEDSLKRIRKIQDNFNNDFSQHFKTFKSIKCICHGDFKQTNLMYRETEGTVTEVFPVDYQLIYYGCPINDFMYLIAFGTDREFRKNHLGHLKNFYYESLKDFLEFFKMDLEVLFPRDQFETQFKESLSFALIWAIIGLPFHFATESDVSKLAIPTVDSQYKHRLQGFVDDFIEWGYI